MARDLEALSRQLEQLEVETRELYKSCNLVARARGVQVVEDLNGWKSRQFCCRLKDSGSVAKFTEAAPTTFKKEFQNFKRRNHYTVTVLRREKEWPRKIAGTENTRKCFSTSLECPNITTRKINHRNDAFVTTMFNAPTPDQQKQIDTLESQLTEMLMQRDILNSQLIRYNGTSKTSPIVRHKAHVITRQLDKLHVKIQELWSKLNTLRSCNNL